jgi:hypothetical protein
MKANRMRGQHEGSRDVSLTFLQSFARKNLTCIRLFSNLQFVQ